MLGKISVISLAVIVAVVMLFLASDTSENTIISNSVLGQALKQFAPADWNEVKQRNIVKNSIPITLLEKSENNCTVNAENFDYIISHKYFKRSQELAKELQYDKENNTLVISCDKIPEDKSTLHVWYATTEALNHSEKYEYFVVASVDDDKEKVS